MNETYQFMQKHLHNPTYAREMIATAHTVGINVHIDPQQLDDEQAVALAQQVLDLATALQLRRAGMLH